ncbi:MAG: dienelactone hydrolase [Planctomycetota bacterium]|jgi:dienelactone hydrolase
MLLTLGLCLCSVPTSNRFQSQDVIPRDYLTIKSVDNRGRRPFRPDAVFRTHIWNSASGAPSEGLELIGEKEEAQVWSTVEASESGQVSGRLGYAYTNFEAPEEMVMLAKLSGASILYVNGNAYAGDVYGFGFGGVPVRIEAGLNDVYVTGIRGGFNLKFLAIEQGILHGGWDDTLPHLVAGQAPSGFAGVEISNASLYASGPLSVTMGGGAFTERSFVVDGLPALGVTQLALPLAGEALAQDVEGPLSMRVRITASPLSEDAGFATFMPHAWSKDPEAPNASVGRLLDFELSFGVRRPGEKVQRTYLSGVDGSVQKYALVPPSAGSSESEWTGLVVSCHGAGVEAWGQAACYKQRPDFWLVAPTNRRKFGFDWQDWGRRDAYDVIALALEESGVDERNLFVTGHSMGGHGTWHLAANDLDRFAACAPSAGWSGFDSYGGRPEGARRELWHAADSTSLTPELIINLKQLPTYVLHGTADDNVPATEALEMMRLLSEAGGSFDSHFEGGAGHWWGNRCVDWPGIFDFFRGRSVPQQPNRIQFRSAGPAIDATHHWLRVEQSLDSGAFVDVEAAFDKDASTATLTTNNIAWMAVQRTLAGLTVDEQELDLSGRKAPYWIRNDEDTWSVVQAPPPASMKSSKASGPFKLAFDRHYVMVVGTVGTAEETAGLLARAQFDAGQWRYRGNGRSVLVRDTDFLAGGRMSCNVILYGNRDSNSAWTSLLGEDCPIDASRGKIVLRAGDQNHVQESDQLGCVFIYPRQDESGSLVGVFADSGLKGTRIGSTLAPFVSGVGYPDFALYDASILEVGDEGVSCAGWFTNDWSITDLGQ